MKESIMFQIPSEAIKQKVMRLVFLGHVITIITFCLRYTEGFKFYEDQCDSHFVAFSVENYDVDKIYDADVRFTTMTVSWSYSPYGGEELVYGEPVEDTLFLSEIDTGSNDGDGWLGVKYTWNRISTAKEFLSEIENTFSEEIVTSVKNDIADSDFVFRFLETGYKASTNENYSYMDRTDVSEVGVLRLHFISNGKVYNLGVVSDLVGTGNDPLLNLTISDNFENEDWWIKIMMFLSLIVLLILGSYVPGSLTFVFNVVTTGFSLVISLLFSIISFPFKLLGMLLKE